ncbi:hypothetical protein ACN4EK_09625 [Pantanalinema rosaneae CENA516]
MFVTDFCLVALQDFPRSGYDSWVVNLGLAPETLTRLVCPDRR